jgi:hypothetical protein
MPGFALTSFILDRNQSHHWLLPLSDDNLFAPACPLDQPRKFGFGLMDGDGFDEINVS